MDDPINNDDPLLADDNDHESLDELAKKELEGDEEDDLADDGDDEDDDVLDLDEEDLGGDKF
jgi:hypothetical protein